MTDQPENLVLMQLRDLRREVGGAMESVVAAMRATHRVYERLEMFQGVVQTLAEEIAGLRGDISAHRYETRKSDLHLEA